DHATKYITEQNPVDEEALMTCNDKCIIKSTGVSIIGVSGTELSVKNDQEQFNLLLKKGQVDFILSGSIGKMGFYTADRQYASADIIYNASTNTPVRGYMEVTSTGDTKIGVSEGRLIFNTVEGAKTVDSNNYIVLAQANLEASNESVAPGTEGDNDSWECNNENTGRLCDKDATDWYCDDENMGKECDDDIAGVAWKHQKIAATTAATVVTGAAAWGVYKYFDDDDNDRPVSASPSNAGDSSSTSSKKPSSSPSSSSPAFIPRNPSPNM
ncbi:MAG: hypothetical protein D3909_15485, partial [Candidatus Electrothrix sp. ATG1]|nr:hypothetical protein [Candidatus Electrothrix sp. ATG1]